MEDIYTSQEYIFFLVYFQICNTKVCFKKMKIYSSKKDHFSQVEDFKFLFNI